MLSGLLAACGGGGSSPASGPVTPVVEKLVPVTGAGTTTSFSFDLGTVVGNRYYFTDRTNGSVDVFDTNSGAQVAQIKGFTGQGPDNSMSGPDGINPVGNLLYVGDVNSVKIVNPSTNTIIKTITVGNQGVRADEGCVDPVHNLYMIATPEAATPYVTVINTQTQTVVSNITFTDPQGFPSGGLEQCQYDPGTDAFYINNDGTTANPHGELDVLPGPAIRAVTGTVNYTTLPGVKMYSLGNCDPTGLALGPGSDIAAECREGTAGAPLEMVIMNRNTGAVLTTLNAGGGDQLIYSPEQNRYFGAASRWTPSGTSSGASCVLNSVAMCTPRLITVDAASRSVISMTKSGNNAHSVAFDPGTGRIFMPVSSDTKPGGCADCSNGTAGLLILTTNLASSF